MQCTMLRMSVWLLFLSIQLTHLHASDAMGRSLLGEGSDHLIGTAPSGAMLAGQRQDVLCVVSDHSTGVAFSIAAIVSGTITSVSMFEGLKNFGINATNELGETLLVQACRLNCLPAVELCCRIGVAINQPDSHGNTPLTVACAWLAKANEDLIRILLTHGAEINGIFLKLTDSIPTKCWPRQTPLFMMATTDKVALVKTMIESGALFGFSRDGTYYKGAKAYKNFMRTMRINPTMHGLLARNAPALSPCCCCMQ